MKTFPHTFNTFFKEMVYLCSKKQKLAKNISLHISKYIYFHSFDSPP